VFVVADKNYFDADEEDALQEAWAMMQSDKIEHDTLREVILNETVYDERALDYWAAEIDNYLEMIAE
jgi:hypothetical protein